MLRALRRHLKEAVLGITRHFAMSLSAASAVTVTLLLMSILVLIIGNVSQITVNLQESVTIFVRIDNEVLDSDIPELQRLVSSIDGVKSIIYSDKDSELDKLIETFGEDGKKFESYRGENNPLSRVFEVEVKNNYKIADVSSLIAKVPGIKEAMFGGVSTEQFIESLDMVRNGGALIVLALGLLDIFLVSNTIRITIFARQEEIAIMRHVGATNGYVRTPFVLEGVFIGILGSIIPMIVTIIGYNFFYIAMDGKLVTGMLTLLPVFPFTLWVNALLITMSIVVGFVGSFLSVNKNLRWKR